MYRNHLKLFKSQFPEHRLGIIKPMELKHSAVKAVFCNVFLVGYLLNFKKLDNSNLYIYKRSTIVWLEKICRCLTHSSGYGFRK